MRFTALERAFATIDLLIAGASAVMVAAAAIYAFSTFTHAAHTQAYNSSAKAAAQTVVDSLERDCGGAIACFVPSNDVGGNNNLDGHEIAMYTRDAAGAGKFWSYCYRASGTTNCSTAAKPGAMNLYGAYAWTDLPQNGGAGPVLDGAIASNVLGVTAKTIPTSQLLNATANPLTAAVFQTAGYTTIQDVTRQTGYTNVLAGNQVTIVSITTEGLTRTIHIAAGARPTHVDTVIGQITPSPNALTAIGGGTNLIFANPIAAGQSTGISESNYGTRATTPAQIYTLTSNSCSSVVTDNPSGNLNPVADGTGDATFTVTPLVHVAPSGETCTLVYSDNVGQTASFAVTVGATFAPSAQAGAVSYLSGNAATFTVSEQNYEPIASGGGFTAATSGVCNPPTLVTETMSGTTYIATYTAATSSNGACSFSAVDVYGQSAIAGTSIIAQQLVCNTDPNAGQTIGTIQYIGTTAIPPCPAPTPPPTAPPTVPPVEGTPTPPGTGVCPTMCLTILANLQQTLPNPPYSNSAATSNSCSPANGPFGPINQCPYMIGQIPINISRINQSALCWIAFPLLTMDNDGWPISLVSMTADITPVAWYDALTGFLYVANNGGPSVIWTPPGFLVSSTSFPGEDMYYIQNIMPNFNSGGRYLWVALSYWQLPAGADAAGPVPLSMDGGLEDPYLTGLDGGLPSECARSSVYGGPLVFGS